MPVSSLTAKRKKPHGLWMSCRPEWCVESFRCAELPFAVIAVIIHGQKALKWHGLRRGFGFCAPGAHSRLHKVSVPRQGLSKLWRVTRLWPPVDYNGCGSADRAGRDR